MTQLDTLVGFCNQLLCTESIKDYSGAHNGLQLANNGTVTKIAVAVDASESSIRKAVEQKADLLIVHHGMFWHGVKQITGNYYRKLKFAMDHNLAIYSSHLPLDIHPEIGNNILLAKLCDLKNRETLTENGTPIAIKGISELEITEFIKRVESAVGCPVHFCNGGLKSAGKVAVMTGSAGSEIEKIKSMGIDTLLTGEGPHWSYVLAEEIEVNIIYAGHYATETFGVIALGKKLSNHFKLPPSIFINNPTGL